jgi:AmmeMemoRadiSam system protein B
MLGPESQKVVCPPTLLSYRKDISIVPIVVGNLNKEREAEYGRILAPYLTQPDVLFIVSSDFCHW